MIEHPDLPVYLTIIETLIAKTKSGDAAWEPVWSIHRTNPWFRVRVADCYVCVTQLDDHSAYGVSIYTLDELVLDNFGVYPSETDDGLNVRFVEAVKDLHIRARRVALKTEALLDQLLIDLENLSYREEEPPPALPLAPPKQSFWRRLLPLPS